MSFRTVYASTYYMLRGHISEKAKWSITQYIKLSGIYLWRKVSAHQWAHKHPTDIMRWEWVISACRHYSFHRIKKTQPWNSRLSGVFQHTVHNNNMKRIKSIWCVAMLSGNGVGNDLPWPYIMIWTCEPGPAEPSDVLTEEGTQHRWVRYFYSQPPETPTFPFIIPRVFSFMVPGWVWGAAGGRV